MVKMNDALQEYHSPSNKRKMEKRKGTYWWHCFACNSDLEWRDVTRSRGMAQYIREKLLYSGWKQTDFGDECLACDEGSCWLVYNFPKFGEKLIRVHHIVGLGEKNDIYIPMIWEISPEPFEERWFEFKYLDDKGITGLNKPATFSREELAQLFEKYCSVTGQSKFP